MASHESSSTSSDGSTRPARKQNASQAIVSVLAASIPLIGTWYGANYLETSLNIPHILTVFYLIAGLNLLGWMHGALFRTEKFYDCLGASSYVLATLYSLRHSTVYMSWNSALWIRQALLSSLILIWAARLGVFLVIRIWKSGHDRRFLHAKENPAQYLCYWCGQIMWAFIVGLPVYVSNLSPITAASSTSNDSGNGIFSKKEMQLLLGGMVDELSLGFTLFALGFYIEARADSEKALLSSSKHSTQQRVKSSSPAMQDETTTTTGENKQEEATEASNESKKENGAKSENRRQKTLNPWIDTGLWALSRHPNYLGEILLWTGISIAALDLSHLSLAKSIICALSPAFITLLLTRVSGIPLLEARADKEWGHLAAYQKYKSRTGILLPLPLDRVLRWITRALMAFVAGLAAHLCMRMFTYVAHCLDMPDGELNSYPWLHLAQPIQFDLIDPNSYPYIVIVLVNTLWNALLIAQFGFCHVGFARPAIYRWIGVRYHRAWFMAVTCFSYHVIMRLWRHQREIVLWNFAPFLFAKWNETIGASVPALFMHSYEFYFYHTMPALLLPFITLCISTVFKLDAWFFIGIKQPFMSDEDEKKLELEFEVELEKKQKYYQKINNNNGNKEQSTTNGNDANGTDDAHVFGQKTLEVTGMYKYVRHPMYFWLQTCCVLTPFMTFDRMMYFIFTTLLLMVGLKFEERKLIREFGQQYIDYMKITPMLFPSFRSSSAKQQQNAKKNN